MKQIELNRGDFEGMAHETHEPAEDGNVTELLLADRDQVPLRKHAVDECRVGERLVVTRQDIVLFEI